MNRDSLMAVFQTWDTRNRGVIHRNHLFEVMKILGLNNDQITRMMSYTCTGEELQYADFVDWVCFPAACVPSGQTVVQPKALGRKCKLFVGANWKCSLESFDVVDKLIKDMNSHWMKHGEQLADIEMCVFPPYVFLDRIRQQLHPEIRVGSQNAWDAAPGFNSTGVVSASMLHAVGCRWVLLGHSDRRNTLGESDALICDKVDKCLSAGLSVNLTIGEKLEAREAGNAISTLIGQLSAAVANVPQNAWSRMAVAYEPVWAIGEGATPCSPEETQRVLSSLRAWIRERAGDEAAHACRLLYTGSVNEKNADQYSCLPDVDGFVVGRAGLDISKLGAICSQLSLAKVQDSPMTGA